MFNRRVRRLSKLVNVILCLSMVAQLLAGCIAPTQRIYPVVATPVRPTQDIQTDQQEQVGLDPQPISTPFPTTSPAQRSTPSAFLPEPTKAPGGSAPTSTGLDIGLPPRPPGLASLKTQPARAAFRVALDRSAGADTAMAPGWYLVSILEQPLDTRPTAVLASIAGSYSRVYAYDACDASDPWKVYDPTDPAGSDLTAIDQRMGFWIEMTGAATLHVSGTRPANTTIQLCKGWNLIGYPQALALPVSNALASIEGRYDRVFAWDPMNADNPWDFEASGAPNWANQLQTLRAGRGYWIHATQDAVLNIATPSLPPSMSVPGFIGGPANTSTISGQVPITLAAGITLTSVTVDYWPVNDLSAAQVLVTGIDGHGGETLATFDTTTLANGAYVIRVSGADSDGNVVASGVMVTVQGEYKPGRVRFTVTDLTVPVVGLPISIGRTYDSLEREQSGDFGYGWSLAVANPKLEVNPTHDVTLTMPDGKRVTFYFRPRFIWSFGIPGYLPEVGVYGSLTANGCGLVVVSGGQHFCFPGGLYQESISGYTYTDPYGRVYSMGVDGKLKSIKDLNDNTLTFDPDGITSSAGGLQVAFARDDEGRITQITDPAGNAYRYGYDAASNLISVTMPSVITPTLYAYDSDHFFLSATDARGNSTIVDTYYPDGRLKSETDALGNTFQYSYGLDANITTLINPDGGLEISTYDTHGELLRRTDPLSQTTAYTYDSNHNLLSRSDALGHTTSYTYDENGNRASVTNALGETSTTTYNQYGGPVTKTDALGNVQTIGYDRKFRPILTSDSLGALGGYTWDDQGSPLTRFDGNGKVTRFAYDQYGNLITETDPLMHVTRYAYDLLGRRISTTDALSNTTLYDYDALGHVTVVTEPLGKTTHYEYDPNGNRTAIVDALGNRTTYSYNAFNQKTKVMYPGGFSESYTYDWRGNVLTHTDRAGHIAHYEYDRAGQLISITYAEGTADAGTVRYTYDAVGRKVSESDALGHITTFAYDDVGRMLEVTDPLAYTTAYTYDNAGRHISITDPNGRQTRYIRDIRGRTTITIFADDTAIVKNYDGIGNLVSRTDQAGKATTYAYDDAGRLLAVTNPLGQTTTYAYDAVGNLLSITDANDHQTSFAYDPLYRQTRKSWSDGSYEAFGYDANGNLLSHRLTDGNTNTFVYDALNRLTQTGYFDAQIVTATYTLNDQRQTVTDGRGTTYYEYDNRDRLIRLVQPNGQAIAYTYDAVGNRLSITTSAGTTTYDYNSANQLSAVTDPQGNTYTYAYDSAGLRTQLAYPNGIVADYGYDLLNRLTSVTQRRDSTLLASYTYTLSQAGNRLGVVEIDGSSIQWAYDAAYRLTEEIRQDSSGAVITQMAFSYDAVGNRLSKVVNGLITNYTYNALDQLMSAGTVQYGYDERGNLIQITNGSNITHYRFDAADRLVEATLPDGTSTSFTYDAEGRRVRLVIDAQVTQYLWDEGSLYGDVVLETDGDGTQLASYSLGESELLEQNRNGATSFYLHDGQGNVRLLTDSAGNTTDNYGYTAYGELQNRQGATINPYLYASQQFDPVTGLYSLRARYYNPAEGRFLSRDSADLSLMNPIEINRYVYVANDPINVVDYTGLQGFTEYSETNGEQSSTEGPAAAETGSAVEDALAAQDAVFEREGANALFRQANFFTKKGPLNITVGQGHYVVDGEAHLLAGTNESNSAYFLQRIEEGLRPLISEDTTWLGGTEGTQHFEQLVVNFAKGLPENSRVVVGVANRICGEVCIPMLEELGGEQVAGGVWRVILENGTKIFLLGR